MSFIFLSTNSLILRP